MGNLTISLDRNELLNFDYYKRVNQISGCQGLGKSKLIQDLGNILKAYKINSKGIESNVDLQKVDIASSEKLTEHNFKKWESGDYIIFIDNYDRYYDKEIADFVCNSKNTFFLISRKYGLQFSSFYGENMLKYDGKTYRLVNMKYDAVEFFKIATEKGL